MVYIVKLIISDFTEVDGEYKRVKVKKEFRFEDGESCQTFISEMVYASSEPITLEVSKKILEVPA